MEDSKKHILQTALKLFLEKSYKAVTFQELMEKTGFSKGAFFHYFKNKQEIFEAVIDMYLGHFMAVDFTQLPQTNLREFLDAYFPTVRKMRTGFLPPEVVNTANRYALMFEAARILPDFKDKVTRDEGRALAAWTSLITNARTRQEIKAAIPDEQLARLFIDASHGIVIHSIMTDSVETIETEALAAWNNIYLLIKH